MDNYAQALLEAVNMSVNNSVDNRWVMLRIPGYPPDAPGMIHKRPASGGQLQGPPRGCAQVVLTCRPVSHQLSTGYPPPLC